MTGLTAAEVSESARAFLAAVSVAPDVLELRPDYRLLVMVAERLEPGAPDQISDELLAQAETRARITLDGRGTRRRASSRRLARRLPGVALSAAAPSRRLQRGLDREPGASWRRGP